MKQETAPKTENKKADNSKPITGLRVKTAVRAGLSDDFWTRRRS